MGRFHDKLFTGDSQAYRAARDELLAAEIDLRGRIEAVAAPRRRLPLGCLLAKDCESEEIDSAGAIWPVRFSGLFARQGLPHPLPLHVRARLGEAVPDVHLGAGRLRRQCGRT